MTASAGAASAQPTTPTASSRARERARSRAQPAPLLEQRIDPGVELRGRRVDALRSGGRRARRSSCISWKMRSHSGIFGAARTRSSWRANACDGASAASAGARHALRRGGRLPVSAWKRCIVSGSLRNAISRHAASLRGEPLNSTRLEPPAVETPGPSGPGSGAVAQSLLALARQAAPELADVPRAADIEREQAARELVPDVRDLRRRRSPAQGRRGRGSRRSRARAGTPGCENAPRRVVVGQQRALLQRQREQRVRLVERQQHAVAVRAAALPHRAHRADPFGPGLRRLRHGRPRAAGRCGRRAAACRRTTAGRTAGRRSAVGIRLVSRMPAK